MNDAARQVRERWHGPFWSTWLCLLAAMAYALLPAVVSTHVVMEHSGATYQCSAGDHHHEHEHDQNPPEDPGCHTCDSLGLLTKIAQLPGDAVEAVTVFDRPDIAGVSGVDTWLVSPAFGNVIPRGPPVV